ncbi:MAG: hypothetical protein QXJ62_02975 [Nitrososphaeria archaeon]
MENNFLECVGNTDTIEQFHKYKSIRVSASDTTSISISLLNDKENNSNLNNNNFEVVSIPDTLIPSYDFIENEVSLPKKPIAFWILHLYSIEGKEKGKVELTSSIITKLLHERYGLNVDEKVVMNTLARLVRKGVLTRRRPFHTSSSGRGGLRKVYYYSYSSLEKIYAAMRVYDETNLYKIDHNEFKQKLMEKLDSLSEKFDMILQFLSKIESKL